MPVRVYFPTLVFWIVLGHLADGEEALSGLTVMKPCELLSCLTWSLEWPQHHKCSNTFVVHNLVITKIKLYLRLFGIVQTRFNSSISDLQL